MSNTDKQLIDLCFVSILKVAHHHSTPVELAEAMIDALGIYDASEIASEILKFSNSIPQNEQGK